MPTRKEVLTARQRVLFEELRCAQIEVEELEAELTGVEVELMAMPDDHANLTA